MSIVRLHEPFNVGLLTKMMLAFPSIKSMKSGSKSDCLSYEPLISFTIGSCRVCESYAGFVEMLKVKTITRVTGTKVTKIAAATAMMTIEANVLFKVEQS